MITDIGFVFDKKATAFGGSNYSYVSKDWQSQGRQPFKMLTGGFTKLDGVHVSQGFILKQVEADSSFVSF